MFTDSTLPMLEAESTHRDHAVVEQVIADLKDSALAQCPAGTSTPTPPGWPARCSPTTSPAPPGRGIHARARTGTPRARLIGVPARLARSAGRLVLHPRLALGTGFDELFRHAVHDPLLTTA